MAKPRTGEDIDAIQLNRNVSRTGRGVRRDLRLAHARTFLQTHSRLLERRRFDHLFEGATSESVARALAAYQNRDGGYGHGLEPDLRTPLSQPVPVWTALWILDEIDRFEQRTIRPVLSYLTSIEVPGGGVPFVLRSARASPHAPWWETGRSPPPASLNPTAGIAAALYKHRIHARWLERASRWCWNQIARIRTVNAYELRVVLSFLDHVPERDRAQQEFERLRPLILGSNAVDRESRGNGDRFHPLDFAPEPDLLSRELFSPREIGRNLDWVEKGQRADGGWTVGFPIWTPITRFEWRGVQTVEMLKLLSRNGRL